MAAGNNFYISAQLHGSGNIAISSSDNMSVIQLNGSTLANTFSGTIDIDNGILRMSNQNGLNGGTVQVDNGTSGLFRIGAGFANGQVNVLSGGIAENDSNFTPVTNLHLNGGQLRGDGNRHVGNAGSNGSKI